MSHVTLVTSYWVDTHTPLKYRWSYYIDDPSNIIYLSNWMADSTVIRSFPPGNPANNYFLTIISEAMNTLGAVNKAEAKIISKPWNVTEADAAELMRQLINNSPGDLESFLTTANQIVDLGAYMNASLPDKSFKTRQNVTCWDLNCMT